ncbi:tryptophan 2,3-dioxygenase [Kwoniella heveanensis CBS 569]|nr:tryptophan 2,3-dioxygenase [Kwoniella heveanensis CBS 569]
MIPQRSPSPIAGPSASGGQYDLPANHFLNLQPSFAQSTELYPSGAPTTSAHESNGLAPNTASLASADFDVDVRTGFLPGSKNVERLEGKYAVWEEALDAARGTEVGDGLIVGGQREKERLWRDAVNTMPIVDIHELRSLPLLRRAHVVLTFLAHFYAHTTPASTTSSSSEKEPIPIPACISVPLLKVSPMLGLPPVLTYADTVLYNFLPSNPAVAPSASSNLPSEIITTFTRTRSEEQFFLISALTEIVGAEALRLMRQSLDELFLADEKALRRLTVYLRRLAQQIDKISDVTMTLMKEVDPEEFYHLIRPWFKGGDADGPTSAGWDYLGLTTSGDREDLTSSVAESSSTAGKRGKLFSGPSAGQSSLIHAIDIFLTVDHSPTEEERAEAMAAIEDPSQSHITVDSTPVSSDAPAPCVPSHGHGHGHATAAPRGEATFVQRMLQYMPLPHRSFILHLSTHPTPLRPLVVHYAHSHPALATAYDGALESLRRFREKHMRVVSLFIVQQARRSPSERVRKMMGLQPETEEERALAEEKGKTVNINEIRGTGGSALFKFLKRCRDNTTKAMVKPSGAGYELE